MSVAIRLSKVGKKGEKKFRIAVVTKRSKNRGKVIEILGFFDKKLGRVDIDQKRLNHWVASGANTSSSVKKIIV